MASQVYPAGFVEVDTDPRHSRNSYRSAQLSDSGLLSSAVNSSSNLVGQGDSAPGSNQDLPYYYPFGLRSSPSSSSESNLKRRKWVAAFHGWRFALGSWLNVLLALIPISWATTFTLKQSHGVTFVLCILSLIPLVRLHDLSTRELANRIGGSRTGLLNGSMSNFVEIVVAISALRKCELRVVQSMLMGSMLSKILLVLGLCFFAGGMNFSEQGFDPTSTQVHSSLLSLSVGAVIIPAAYHFTLGDENDPSFEVQKANILYMSHGVSVVLLFIYVAYLLFQLWSHTYLYKDKHNKTSHRLSMVIREKRMRRKARSQVITSQHADGQSSTEFAKALNEESFQISPPRRPFAPSRITSASEITQTARSADEKANSQTSGPTVRLVHPSMSGRGGVPMSRDSIFSGSTAFSNTNLSSNAPLITDDPPAVEVEEETAISESTKKEPQMSWFMTIFLLIAVTGTVAVTVDWLVEAMDEISTTISKEWVGLILLPAISSVAECITAVKVSVRDELTLSVSVAVGSTIQTALFVIPFTVILGWITNKPLSLLMDPFQSLVLYIAVHTMGYVVADGKSNWLEGVILIGLYVIIAVSFWFYPGSSLPTSLVVCAAGSSA